MYLLVNKKGVIRVKDLAQMLGITAPSVVEFLDRLADKGLVRYEKRELIELTEEGRRIAERVYRRHVLLKSFLEEVLGVPPDLAEEDACKIEHSISEETLKRIDRLVGFLRSKPELLSKIREALREG